MQSSNEQPIIIKRIEDDGHGDHHGGGWKVAYADFMTAMMAFFLLMWIIAASDEEKLRGLADYFTPSIVTADGAGDGVLDGEAMDGKGTRGAPDAPPAPEMPTFGQDNPLAVFDSRLRDVDAVVEVDYDAQPDSTSLDPAPSQDEALEDNGAELIAEAERQQRAEQLDRLREEIIETVRNAPNLAEFAENMKFDVTGEGLRMQIVDHEGRSMFNSGSAQIETATRDLIEVIGETIRDMANPVVISGHTDSVPFSNGAAGYGNWELSADRANATRRILLDSGVAPSRVVRISGLADTDPLDPEHPDAPENRRISVLLQYPDPVPAEGTVPQDE